LKSKKKKFAGRQKIVLRTVTTYIICCKQTSLRSQSGSGSLSKPNQKIFEPEPEPEQVQGSGLQKDVFGPIHFFQKEENQF